MNLSEMLQVAACLGSTFDPSTLRCGWSKRSGDSDDYAEFHAALGGLEKEGLVVKVSSRPRRFSFVHDKIHEAAVDLIPLASRSKFRRHIGELLLQNLGKDRLSSEIFVVVNLLNDVQPHILERESRLRMAELNHQANTRAVTMSSFDSAARYAERDIAFLGGDTFVGDTFGVTLGLFTIGARSERAMGNVETLERYCMSVIKRDDIPLEDKFGVYNTWVDHLLNRNKSEAVAMCIEILSFFDCEIPNNAEDISREMLEGLEQVTTTARTHRLSSLPMLTDKAKLQTIHWLDRLSEGLYVTGDDRFGLPLFRSLKLTLEYGISAYSSVAFAHAGIMLVVAGDFETAAVYGDLAMEALTMSDTEALAARTLLYVNNFISPMTNPLKNSYDPLMEAYDIGTRMGDTESLSWAAGCLLQLRFYGGAPLDALQNDLEKLMPQMKACYAFMQPIYQAVLNPLGQDNLDDPSSLVGIAISNKVFDSCLDDLFSKVSICLHQCMLLTYLGEHVKHAELLSGMGIDYVAQALKGGPDVLTNTFLNGLSCFAAAQETGEERYAELGEICHNRIKTWVEKGNPNVKHYDLFLDAEYAVLKEQHIAATQKYESAIGIALECGFVQDAALACERFCEFHVCISGDSKEAERWIRQAAVYWSRWVLWVRYFICRRIMEIF